MRRAEPDLRRRREAKLRRIEVRVADASAAELVGAEAWSAGVSGLEERELSRGCIELLLYAPAERAGAVRAAVAALDPAYVGPAEPLDERNWSLEWQKGLEAIEIGERLVIRPSFVPATLHAGQSELVIDPGQAFGTGGHASTRLALEWIEVAAAEPGSFGVGSRVLDVGAGTGVLALAALRLGAGSAVGFDLDLEAAPAARFWAEQNGLADRLLVLTGPIEAIRSAPFDWLFANLLKCELLPLTEQVAGFTRRGGRAIFSGMLAQEREEVESALSRVGFRTQGVRTLRDATGDEWISLLMLRG